MILTKRSECTCNCHKPGFVMTHFQACCHDDEYVEKQRQKLKNKVEKL